MISSSEVMSLVNLCFPPQYAEEWDNCGIQVGDPRWPVETVLVALDPTLEVLEEAVSKGAGFILTHHPLIFSPLKRIDNSTAAGRIVIKACQSQVSIFSAHTNLDSMSGGLNDLLVKRMGLIDVEVLVPSAVDGVGLGRIGILPGEPVLLGELANNLKDEFQVSGIRFCGHAGQPISRIAVCSGSGGSLFKQVIASGADAYVTGDLRYHDARDFEAAGIGAIDIGHFYSEHIMVAAVVDILSAAAAAKGLSINVIGSECESDPFQRA